MQSRGLEIVVGFFVCLGIAAVFLLTLRVSNLADVRAGDSYQVQAQFSNIGGLRVGAQVGLAGVRIGRVSDISLDTRTYEAVVSMNIAEEYKIPKDSDASILTAGLLGEQYIGVGPGADLKSMKDGDKFIITQSAVILENLIGQVLYAVTSGNDDDSGSSDGGFDDGFGDGFSTGGGAASLPHPEPKAAADDTNADSDETEQTPAANEPGEEPLAAPESEANEPKIEPAPEQAQEQENTGEPVTAPDLEPAPADDTQAPGPASSPATPAPSPAADNNESGEIPNNGADAAANDDEEGSAAVQQ